MNSDFIRNTLSRDNSVTIKYILLFFIFFIAISQDILRIFSVAMKNYFERVCETYDIHIVFIYFG